ncbi:hypothetical protein HPT27_10530 [Permianibacter sp. IMCC34836]|uniref:DUF6441 family protein n=1 Tax=Permianibacter fluminis TaxID=2738515 RepID=UPI001555107E|nr:DUF6441 family protein [Permianibacter fluminis]NQD37463.1 hypothetical protein [Permianibacter fluminis]
MKISGSVSADAAFKKLKATTREVFAATRRGMYDIRKPVKQVLASQMKRNLRIKRESFAMAWGAFVYAKDKDRAPLSLYRHKFAALDTHVKGASIGAKGGALLIPINLKPGRRISEKSLRNKIRQLRRQGNAFMLERKGKILLMAETIPESRAILQPWNVRIGAQRFSKRNRTPEIPIAVMVPRVTLQKRLTFDPVRGPLKQLLRGAVINQLQSLRSKYG